MNKKIVALALLLLVNVMVVGQQLRLKTGMVITTSVVIENQQYLLPSDSLAKPIQIRGQDVVVDFNGAIVSGTKAMHQPNHFTGIAFHIKDAKRVTIKNLRVKGFKIALLAENVEDLVIDNCDFSYNYRPHLAVFSRQAMDTFGHSSTFISENPAVGSGAALFLKDCNKAIISNTKISGGHHGLVLVRSNNGKVYNNDFSFNSGFGITLLHSSKQTIAYNRISFNVQQFPVPSSAMQQESGGIRLANSPANLIYKNIATHNGVGLSFFTPADRGKEAEPGNQQNVVAVNDFSYAASGGLVINASGHIILKNRFFECDQGISGERVLESRFSENQFRKNRVAMAFSGSQQLIINHNLLIRDQIGMKLWNREGAKNPEGTAQQSRGHIIAANSFNGVDTVFLLAETDSIAVFSNRYDTDVIFETGPRVTNIDREYNDELLVSLSEDITIDTPVLALPKPAKTTGKWAGRKQIRLMAWGPYDFQYPIIWLANSADSSSKLLFEVLGPKGRWQIISVRGLSGVSKKNGNTGTTFTARKTGAKHIQIVAEYKGEGFIDEFGNRVSRQKPFRMVFRRIME